MPNDIHRREVVDFNPNFGRHRAVERDRAGAAPPSGQIVHRFGRDLVRLRQIAPSAGRGQTPPAPSIPLTDAERLGLAAYDLRQSAAFAAQKRQRSEGTDWHFAPTEALARPRASLRNRARPLFGKKLAMHPDACLSERMRGTVAVSVIFVQGPVLSLRFTDGEIIALHAQIQNGLSQLAELAAPAIVTWVHDLATIAIATPSSSRLPAIDPERGWRDATLKALGFGPGWTGVQALTRSSRRKWQTDWAFTAFITKYPLAHFAYAYVGGPYLVMDATAGDWGLADYDRVFAHETCHVFGAGDEYAESGCSVHERFGINNAPNANCENGAKQLSPCIMRRNESALCAHTRLHVGL